MSNETEIKVILSDIASEFNSLDTNLITRFISYAQVDMNQGAWSIKYNLGSAYLTAHLLKVKQFNDLIALKGVSSSGVITKEKLGDEEITFADTTKSMSNSDYASTNYGKLYLELRKGIRVAPITLGSCS